MNHPLGEIASVYNLQMWVCVAFGVIFLVVDISPTFKWKKVAIET